MKRKILILSVLVISFLTVSAGNWQKKYFTDDFGDPDYSKPCYVLHSETSDGYTDDVIDICYANGAFCFTPYFLGEFSVNINSIRAKDANGAVYSLNFYRPHDRSNDFIIKNTSDVNTLINLFEKGHFTLSFHRPPDDFNTEYNYNYRIGSEGTGIRRLSGVSKSSRPSTGTKSGGSGTTWNNGKNTFDGTFKYKGADYGFSLVIDYSTASGKAVSALYAPHATWNFSKIQGTVRISSNTREIYIEGKTADGVKTVIYVTAAPGSSKYTGTMVRGTHSGTCTMTFMKDIP